MVQQIRKHCVGVALLKLRYDEDREFFFSYIDRHVSNVRYVGYKTAGDCSSAPVVSNHYFVIE